MNATRPIPKLPASPLSLTVFLALGLAFALGSLKAAGDLDTGFNPNANGSVLGLAVQADGKVLIGGGFTTVGGLERNNVARLNADGSLDTGFNPNVNGSVNSLTVQADGKVLIGGGFTTVGGVERNNVARLNADGSLDTGFNPDANSQVRGLAVQADGKVLIGGLFTTVGGVERNRVARLNADGSLDTGFNPNANSSVYGLAVQADGKMLIGGFFTSVGGVERNRVARLNADGSLDTGFNPPSSNNSVYPLALQADGKVLIGGFFTTVGGVERNNVARLNADGSLDTSFNPNANGPLFSFAVQADGKLLIGGGFTTVGGVARNRIARLNADGSLDTSFNPNANSSVYGLAVQADGKVLIGGDFTTMGGAVSKNVARLDNDSATHSLTIPDATRVRWSRVGSAPEVGEVVFEQSLNNGATWTLLGAGARIGVTAGWERTGLSLGAGAKVRATGRTQGGQFNGSSGLIRQVYPAVSIRDLSSLDLRTTTATLSATVTVDDIIATVTERGFVYAPTDTNNDPLIGGTGVLKVVTSGTTGSYTAALTGLTQGTGYSYKAYTFSSEGTTYTSVSTFASLSTNADLSNLTLSSGELSPIFASGTLSYTASVSNATNSITVTPTRAQGNATIEVRVNTGTYAAATSGSTSSSLPLNVGSNTVDVRVTAQDGATQKTYTVMVTRMAAPIVTAPTATSITAAGATLGGNVTADGGATITERGVVYSATATNADPLISGTGVTKVTASGTTGVFTAPVTGLTQGINYSYKAYATNSQGTTYTSVDTFTTRSTNANLSALTLSSGTLSPTFATATTAYTASVSNATNSITVTPTRAQGNATIEVRVNTGTYAAVTIGSTSASLPLNVGSNTVDVRVTAQDGVTQKTYTVTVTRMAAPIVTAPTATSITAAGATLGGNVTADGGATITERGVVYSATATNADPLIDGAGVTKVTASGTTGVFIAPVTGLTQGINYSYKAYATNSQGTTYTSVDTFTTRSTNANLSALTLSSGTLSPTFASAATAYTTSVANTVTSITVTPTRAQADATIEVRVNTGTYAAAATGTASAALPLNVGSNTVDVRVTAQDGVTQKTYTVTVTRKASQTITFENPGPQRADATVNLSATGGASSNPISFTVTSGPALITDGVLSFTGVGSVTVTASQIGNANYDSATPVSRTFTVSIALSRNADLSNLTVRNGTLSPTFASGTTAYTASVPNASTSITVTPTRAQAEATIEVRVNTGTYAAAATGTASAALPLNVGSNTVDVRVTAQDGVTQKTYTVTVTRKATQTIIFDNPGPQRVDATVNLSATGGGSSNPISFTVASGPALITDGVLSFTGVGSVTVTASQVGNANYDNATPVSRTFTVSIALSHLHQVPGGGLPALSALGALTVPTFSIGAYEVTGSHWATVVAWAEANAGYRFAGAGAAASGDRPVTEINWFDAAKWCNARTEWENALLGRSLAPAYRVAGAVYKTGTPATPADLTFDFGAGGYRLPTAAEWEYAARGGASGTPSTYPGGNSLDPLGWYVANSNGAVQPAGGKTPNSLGLYDLAGNAAEWTWDAPAGSPAQRLLRGGAWSSAASACELTALSGETASLRLDRSGFRVAQSISLALAAALDAPNLAWESGGEQHWFAQTTPSHDGTDAAESGPISPGQSSWLETRLTGPCDLRFRWDASQRAAEDLFRLETGTGAPILLSSSGNWDERLVELPAGDHTLRWVFVRHAASTGLSQVRLDAVSVTPVTPPTVTTTAAASISGSGAVLGGEVTADGGRAVSTRGVVYATTASPTLGGPGVQQRSAAFAGTGPFSVPASGLADGTTYHARAFATNNVGTSYGENVSFTTDATVPLTEGIGTVTGRALLAGDTQRYGFSLASPSDAAFTTTGIDAATWELRNGGGVLVDSGSGNVDFSGLLLSGNYVLSLTSTGGTTQTFSLDLDASVEAVPKPDLSIGSDPTAATGAEEYSPVVQSVALLSRRGAPVSLFAKVANEGLLPDAMTLRGSSGDNFFAVSYATAQGNVTAQMIAGSFATPVMGQDDPPVALTVSVSPNKRLLTKKVRKGKRLLTTYLRKTYSGFIEAEAVGDANLSDTVLYQVTTTP